MKTKIAVLVGVIVSLIGAVMGVAGMSILKWDFYELDANKYEEKTFEASETQIIKNIDVDVRTWTVNVIKGEKITLTYYESDSSSTDITVEENKLIIKENVKSHFNWFNFKKSKLKFILTVPDGVNLNISGTAADISATDMSFNNIKVTATNADIKLTNCSAFSFFLKSANADVDVNNCDFDELDIDTTNGDVNVKGGVYELLTVHATNGDVDVINSKCQDVKITGVNLDLSLRNIITSKVYVKGTNLDAYILIDGKGSEYTVETNKNSGMPPAQTGTTDKHINLSGVNCDVELRFTQQ